MTDPETDDYPEITFHRAIHSAMKHGSKAGLRDAYQVGNLLDWAVKLCGEAGLDFDQMVALAKHRTQAVDAAIKKSNGSFTDALKQLYPDKVVK